MTGLINLIDVKRSAVGRWGAILENFGFEPGHLTGKHGPCPVCEGSDRFRALDDFNETGAVFCNQCFNERNGDGLAAIAWRNGWTFPKTLQAVAEYLRISPTTDHHQNGHSNGHSVTQFVGKQNPPREKPPAKLYGTEADAIASMNAGSLVKKFPYLDRIGNHYATTCRFEPKTFRPVGKFAGGWGVKGPEYRLPYHADTLDAAEVVYVVEGEGVADTLRQLGLVATTSMGGAQAGDKTDWSVLAGKRVIILPDNDDPGRKYADTVTQLLIAISCRVKIVTLPNLPPKGDAVQWLNSFGEAAEPSDIVAELERLVAGTPEQVAASTGLKFRTAGEMIREFPELRPELIHGLLRFGETMNVIAASKTGKSWLMLGLAFAITCGLAWLGRFWCKRGKVLYIDNELHPETLAKRIKQVADSMGLSIEDYESQLVCVNLRGDLQDLNHLSAELLKIEAGEFDAIVLDAWYRLQPSGSDENSNGDVTQLYNLLDSVASRIGSAFICVHHSSKGNQSGKAVTDVGSGAGAQSRAADTHLVLRPHEADGAIVVDAAVRSWAPIEPFVVRWNWPSFSIAEDLDPKDLRTDKPKKKSELSEGAPSPDDGRKAKELDARRKILEAYSDRPDGDTANQIKGAAGMSGNTFPPINAALLREGLIVGCRVKKNFSEYDGFKITEAGLEALGQLGQLGQNLPQSDLSDRGGDTPRTTALSLESGVCPRGVPTSDRMGLYGEHPDNRLSDMPEWESKA